MVVTFLIRPRMAHPFYYTQSRCDGILYGCLLYYAMQCTWVRALLLRLKPCYLGKMAACVLLVIIAICPTLIASRAYAIPIICIAATLLVALASVEGNFVGFGKLDGVLNYLGTRSYSLYVVHFPMLMLTRAFALPFQWEMTVVAALLVLSGTELCYRLVERPLLTYGRRR